ncbi:hypothetical protein LINGRAHAP2_LOCUS4971 [Linum grandiflorum]
MASKSLWKRVSGRLHFSWIPCVRVLSILGKPPKTEGTLRVFVQSRISSIEVGMCLSHILLEKEKSCCISPHLPWAFASF